MKKKAPAVTGYAGGNRPLRSSRARQEREGESWFQQIQGQDQPLLRMFQKDYITCLVHDLKGPASTALAALQLMEKRMEEEISEDNLPFFHRYCSFIEKSCYRMFLTVNDLWETAAAAQEDLELAFVQWHLEDLIQQASRPAGPMPIIGRLSSRRREKGMTFFAVTGSGSLPSC